MLLIDEIDRADEEFEALLPEFSLGLPGLHTGEGTPDPAGDAAEWLWIGATEVEGVDFAWERDRGFVRAALEQRD